ncbi:MAG TPA: 5-oxoprolinase, partial [Acidobacteria bacterium]|nr:5-oxoprolinase [Acidobacteriota bacterium]
ADALLERLAEATGHREERDAVLEGLLDLADETMADAIRRVSIREGYDPALHGLVVFGGAGPQHGFAVARRLGIERVVVPRNAGLLSALGLAGARREEVIVEQVLEILGDDLGEVESRFDAASRRAAARLIEQGVAAGRVLCLRRQAGIRFVGQEATLTVDVPRGADPRALFVERYRSVFGHLPGQREVEWVSLRVVMAEQETLAEAFAAPVAAGRAAARPAGHLRCRLDGTWRSVPVFERRRLAAGTSIEGPALVAEAHSMTVLPDGWSLSVSEAGHLVGRWRAAAAGAAVTRPRAVEIELFSRRLGRIAEEMGEALRRSAVSTNIRQRLDYSCALLDSGGRLLVNAPHVPVHLGSLGLCARAVMEVLALQPGDTVLTNHPAFGGSHLPDLTLLSPVFDHGGALRALVASRAHHAEIGGRRPGSMPPDSRHLAEEGVVFPPLLLMRHGRARWQAVRERLTAGPWPTRALEDNLADLRAALAANLAGVRATERLIAERGAQAFDDLCRRLRQRVEQRVRARLAERAPFAVHTEEILDDGSRLPIAIESDGDRLRVDFRGAGAVDPGNLNATPAIVNSVVLYVLRVMLGEDLPL